jgi:iron complex outermembrane receptor protein
LKSFLLACLVVFLTMQAAAQTCSLRVSGHVEDTDTKDKLIAASVTIVELHQTLVTDASGNFLFEGICPGTYTLLIQHVSCDSVRRQVSVNKNMHLDILMPHARKVLGAVTVAAQKALQNTGFKKELSIKELEQSKGLSLAESLSKLSGVTMLQTGSTISKPVIHGLHGNRILTINNGVRQEGQQWGNEHAPEVDPFMADKLTVIKGVDELKYGSDAIGGVILAEPRLIRHEPGRSFDFNSVYFSNNREYVLSGVYDQRLKTLPALGFRLQGTFKQGGNVATPNYRLNNTAMQEKSFSGTVDWNKKSWHSELFYSYFQTRLGIFTGSHIGNLTDLQTAIAADQPNPVFLGQNSYQINRPYQQVQHQLLKSKTSYFHNGNRYTLQIAGQYNQRKEYDIVRSATNTSPQLDLSILTMSEDLSWEHPRWRQLTGTVGLSAVQQENSYAGRYFIPNYNLYGFGGYAIEKWQHHQWEVQGGIRWDYKRIDASRVKTATDVIDNNFNFNTLASSWNLLYKAGTAWKFNLALSMASRAPHVNELLSDGIHHGTATYEKGDLNLVPEKSFNLSLGINWKSNNNRWYADVLGYTNHIRDFIYQQPKPNDPVLTISGSFPLIVYTQTNARLQGLDATLGFHPIPSIDWQNRFSFLAARDISRNDWLIWMPANRLNSVLTWDMPDHKRFSKSYLSVEAQAVFTQKRVPDESNGKQDYKAPPPGYQLVNVHAGTTISLFRVPVTVGISARNLFNAAYRDYLNSMRYFTDDMGRNISFRLTIHLTNKESLHEKN